MCHIIVFFFQVLQIFQICLSEVSVMATHSFSCICWKIFPELGVGMWQLLPAEPRRVCPGCQAALRILTLPLLKLWTGKRDFPLCKPGLLSWPRPPFVRWPAAALCRVASECAGDQSAPTITHANKWGVLGTIGGLPAWDHLFTSTSTQVNACTHVIPGPFSTTRGELLFFNSCVKGRPLLLQVQHCSHLYDRDGGRPQCKGGLGLAPATTLTCSLFGYVSVWSLLLFFLTLLFLPHDASKQRMC